MCNLSNLLLFCPVITTVGGAFPLEKEAKINLLKSKLNTYRMALYNARQKGNSQEAEQWIQGIANVKKQLSTLTQE